MIVKECMAICDVCHESHPDWKQDRVRQVKALMKEYGWKRIKGKDVCDECLKEGER